MADTTLERIDATLNQSCACGCGRPLDPDGPSAWWFDDDCVGRGTRALTGADNPEDVTGKDFDTLARVAAAFDVPVELLLGRRRRQATRLAMFRYKADHRCLEKYYWDESIRRTITVEIAHPSQGLRSDGG